MNFFNLYIGDYQRDTGTLTLAEHGAFILMLQHHYATEKPIPTGKDLYCLLRANSKAEREAVDAVARRFWAVTPDGLVNARAGEEIARAKARGGINRRIAAEREAKKRAKNEGGEEHDSCSERATNRQPIHNHNHNQSLKSPIPEDELSGVGVVIKWGGKA